jgi:hypothetical protein
MIPPNIKQASALHLFVFFFLDLSPDIKLHILFGEKNWKQNTLPANDSQADNFIIVTNNATYPTIGVHK